ncbi:hypothetical protein ACIFOT_32200, partial [Neobacillus sp. NRS-1170]|uniref:hypothetical protein n=1 Tax=Neobacillus sp. NRS-1170 TaxID=3233898 RepID=UPI003D28F6F8
TGMLPRYLKKKKAILRYGSIAAVIIPRLVFHFYKILLAFPILPDGDSSNCLQNSVAGSLLSVVSSCLAIPESVYATLTVSSTFPPPITFIFLLRQSNGFPFCVSQVVYVLILTG